MGCGNPLKAGLSCGFVAAHRLSWPGWSNSAAGVCVAKAGTAVIASAVKTMNNVASFLEMVRVTMPSRLQSRSPKWARHREATGGRPGFHHPLGRVLVIFCSTFGYGGDVSLGPMLPASMLAHQPLAAMRPRYRARDRQAERAGSAEPGRLDHRRHAVVGASARIASGYPEPLTQAPPPSGVDAVASRHSVCRRSVRASGRGLGPRHLRPSTGSRQGPE